MKTALFLVVTLIFIENAQGYCYIHPFQDDHCTAPNGVTMPAGSKLRIQEKCEDCSCSTSASDTSQTILSCCGYGIHAGVYMAPAGCKVVAGEDGCSVKFVMMYDETQVCHDM